MYAGWSAKLRMLRPDIVIFNMGLHWLHFYGHTNMENNKPTRKGPNLCAVQAWLEYDSFLSSTIELAAAAGATQVYAKTTNFVCADKYDGSYANASAAFSSPDPTVKAATMSNCVHSLLADMGAHAFERQADRDHAHAYCRHGVFDNTGASFLNKRLEKMFADRTSSGAGAGADHAYAFKKGAAKVVLFNDTAIQACRYTDVSDGRHYHPLNTVRIRLLANLIVQTSGNSSGQKLTQNMDSLLP